MLLSTVIRCNQLNSNSSSPLNPFLNRLQVLRRPLHQTTIILILKVPKPYVFKFFLVFDVLGNEQKFKFSHFWHLQFLQKKVLQKHLQFCHLQFLPFYQKIEQNKDRNCVNLTCLATFHFTIIFL